MWHAVRLGEGARRQPRDIVECRARATASDDRKLSLLVVNTSIAGLMARHDHHAAIVGEVAGVVRWSLGGRIGCELD